MNTVPSFPSEEIFNKIFIAKKHIYCFINQKELLNTLTEIVESSGYFKFQVPSDKRFLKLNNLFLNLELTEKAIEELPELTNKKLSRNDIVENRRTIIHDNIVQPFFNVIQAMFKRVLGIKDNTDSLTEVIEKILPENCEELVKQVNNFINFNENEQDEFISKFGYIFSVCSSIILPPESIDINEDFSFRLEILV